MRRDDTSGVQPGCGPSREELLAIGLRCRETAAESELHHYWRLFYGRRWFLLAAGLVGLAIASFITLRQPRLYQAQATVEFKQPLPPGKDLRLVDPEISIPPALAVRLLTTKVLAARVINALRAKGETWFDPPAAGTVGPSAVGAAWAAVRGAAEELIATTRLILGSPPADLASNGRATAQKWEGVDLQVIDRYYSHIAIKPVAMTSLADIVVTHPDPQLAAQLANDHAQAFIEMDVETKVASLSDAQSLFYQQLNEVKGKLEASRQALSDFQREHGILSLPKDNTTITRESLQQLNTLLTQTQGERIVAEANYRNAAGMSPDELAKTLPDEALQALRQELLGLKSKYEAHLKDYGPNHPDMASMRARIAALDERLRAAGVQARQHLAAVLEVAQAKERELRENFRKLSQTASQEDRQLVQLLILQRDLESNQALYTTLLKQAKEADLNTAGFRWTSVKLVDKAVPPSVPAYPATQRNLGLGVLLGLLAGIAACIMADRLDTRIHTPEEVVAVLQLPAFGVVPNFHQVADASRYGRRAAEIGDAPAPGRDLVTLANPSSMVSEAYRGIRTNLMFASPGRPPKTVLITSSQPDEGKTVTAINLAVSLALSGSRVLIVDADFRKPECHTAMRVAREPGLSNVLTGQCDLAAAVVRSPLSPNGQDTSTNGHGLFVLPAGALPPNPSELLGSGVMSELLRKLAQEFEFILIDSPPVLVVTDSVVMATKADGVLMVVKGGEWGRHVAQRALSQLEAVRANILGVVLNCVASARGGYPYHYYRRYYEPYYGRSSKADEGVT